MLRVPARRALAALLPLGALAFAPPDGWRLFRSSTGFMVRYPGTWVRFADSPSQLSLRSSPGGATGVIIKAGQAYLWVAEPREAPSRTLSGLIAYFTPSDVDSVTPRRALPVGGARGGCRTLTEVVTWEPVVPREGLSIRPPDVVNALYFCDLGERIIVTCVRNYVDDTRTHEYQRIGLRVARSIRVVPPAGERP